MGKTKQKLKNTYSVGECDPGEAPGELGILPQSIVLFVICFVFPMVLLCFWESSSIIFVIFGFPNGFYHAS